MTFRKAKQSQSGWTGMLYTSPGRIYVSMLKRPVEFADVCRLLELQQRRDTAPRTLAGMASRMRDSQLASVTHLISRLTCMPSFTAEA